MRDGAVLALLVLVLLVRTRDSNYSPTSTGSAESTSEAGEAFTHRSYLGWISDLSRRHLPDTPWPSVAITPELEADYIETLEALHRLGYNEITLWGFFTNDAWKLDVEHTIDTARAAKIRRWIDAAHARDIKIIAGMGVYSWGFSKILAAYPEVRCQSNPSVMTPLSEESWRWQQRVIDYVLNNFAFDGLSLQSADRGHCTDGALARISDEAYHADLIYRTSQYIKARSPALLVGVSGWGMDLSRPEALPFYDYLATRVDTLVTGDGSAGSPEHRARLIEVIKPTSFGSIASPNVEPIHQVPRDRYFIPTLMETAQSLKDLYDTGGRALEVYARTRGNIGDEVSMEFIGRLAKAGFADVRAQLEATIESIFAPSNAVVRAELTQIFLDGERAFFDAGGPRGIIRIAPLGQLTYQLDQSIFAELSLEARQAYRDALRQLLARAEAIRSKIGNTAKAEQLVRTLRLSYADMSQLSGGPN